ncbi:hypothetical protein [Calothrix sp. NIES-2098]|uniref:hypothetical protein n=1 Tax=Calothrix sp. NIES-2098 TaxID=1954171 RepID=UPI0030D96425
MTNIQELIEKLQQLEKEREQLLKTPMSPPGVWIHEYTITRRYPGSGNIEHYVYAKWQADKPIFKRHPKPRLEGIVKKGKDREFTCHQHIGRVGSSTGLGMDDKVEDAYEEWNNRKRLEAIDQALKEIEIALTKVMPQETNEA